MILSPSNKRFLGDAASLALTAFGGPNAHIAMMLDVLVEKRKYLTEKELIELNALCQLLPGPTSTQTLLAIGYKLGGAKLATLTLLIWVLPAFIGMSTLAIGLKWFQENNYSLDFLQFVMPVAVGLVGFAAFKIGTKTVTNAFLIVLFLCSVALVLMVNSPFLFPLILIAAGILHALFRGKGDDKEVVAKTTEKPNYVYLIVFAVLFLGLLVLGTVHDGHLSLLAWKFYQYGSLIFGGGQVLIPFIYDDIVIREAWMTKNDFATGYAMVQMFPGPVFSFSAFVGGLSSSGQGLPFQLLGSLVACIGLFLPGALLMYFMFPFWNRVKTIPFIHRAIPGVNASAAAFVFAAAILIFRDLILPESGGFEMSILIDVAIMVATFLILNYTKITSPLVVVVALAAGIIWEFLF